MAIIRANEGEFNAYIYVDAAHKNKINISTPSFRGLVDLGHAVMILTMLMKLNELPDDILDRLYDEVQFCLSRNRR